MQAPCRGRNTCAGRPTAGTLLHDTGRAGLARRVVPWGQQPHHGRSIWISRPPRAAASYAGSRPPHVQITPGTEANTYATNPSSRLPAV
jgi:hypothetical protein